MSNSAFTTEIIPPNHKLVGEWGQEHFGFTDPDVRMAERAEAPYTVETADGPVACVKGDFIVSMPDGERFPIPASIYFGAYQVLGKAGRWHIGKRLIQLRRVWPVTSDSVELTYPNRRAKLHATRGAWIYKCDDDDLGLINANVNTKTHSIVGTAASQADADWNWRFNKACQALIWMPLILTLLALFALAFAKTEPTLSKVLIGLECALLLLGTALAARMRQDRWVLRSAAASGVAIAERFQVAVSALGHRTSKKYPLMALWRAGQTDEPPPNPPKLDSDSLEPVNAAIDATREELRHAVHKAHSFERFADRMGWAGVVLIVGCLALVLTEPERFKEFKLVAAGIPAFLAMIHAFAARRQSQANVASAKELMLALKFLRTRLLAATSVDPASPEATNATKETHDCVRLLCRSVAAYSNQGLEAAIGSRVSPPA